MHEAITQGENRQAPAAIPCSSCLYDAHELCMRGIKAYDEGHDDESVCRCSICFPEAVA
jgi:hypothetical protein